MKYLPLLLLLIGCVTCPVNNEIADVFVAHYAGYGECGDYDAIREDVMPIIEQCEYCSQEFDISPYLLKAPDGAWTSKGLTCYASVSKVAKSIKLIPDKWGCKKPAKINYSILEKECQELN